MSLRRSGSPRTPDLLHLWGLDYAPSERDPPRHPPLPGVGVGRFEEGFSWTSRTGRTRVSRRQRLSCLRLPWALTLQSLRRWGAYTVGVRHSPDPRPPPGLVRVLSAPKDVLNRRRHIVHWGVRHRPCTCKWCRRRSRVFESRHLHRPSC